MPNRRKLKKSQSYNNNAEISRLVQRAIARNAEVKNFDFNIGQNIGTTALFFAVSQPIIQGIQAGMRIGNTIKLRRISLRINAFINSGATFSSAMRFIMFLDKQGDGVYPNVADLLSGTLANSGYSIEQIQEKRFHIILDKLVPFNRNGTDVFIHQKDYQLHNDIYYEAATNVQAANGKNSLYMMVIGTDNINPASVNASILIQYTDS